MNPESIPGVLPLAEALRAWSDVELVNAVDMAEAPFTAEQCDRFQRDWLAEIVQHRLHSNGKRRERYAPKFQALETAWYRLFVHFGSKAAAGEIVLWGRMEKPIARHAAEPLPALPADELLLHPRRNRIIVREDAYRDVFAAPRSGAELLEKRLLEARTAMGSIPLMAAVRNWADPSLISEVCRFERAYTEYEMAAYPARPMLSDPQDLAEPSSQRWMLGLPDFVQLSSAWRALEDDLRARLVRAEFQLKGVMSNPRRELQFEVLPGVWAADFAFDFHRDTVSFDDARYVAVTVSYVSGPEAGVPVDGKNDAGGDEPGEDGLVGVTAASAGQKRGRKDASPIIEEALRMFWDVLFPQGAPAHFGQATEFATRLIKRVDASREWHGRQFPEHGTVRRHLPKIYERVLAEKDRSAQSVQ